MIRRYYLYVVHDINANPPMLEIHTHLFSIIGGIKLQIPTSKLQRNFKLQAPIAASV
jgi:hypothetical protein